MGVEGEGRKAPIRLPGSWPRFAETRERMETAPSQERKRLEVYQLAKSEEQTLTKHVLGPGSV